VLHGREAAQRVVAREGIVEECGFERRQVEAFGEGSRLVLRQLDQPVAQS
jgi:hypothetical protein